MCLHKFVELVTSKSNNDSESKGQSTLRSCQEYPRTILCLFYCSQELPCRAVHERRITRRNTRLPNPGLYCYV